MGCSNLKPTACGNGRKPYLTRAGCGNTIHFDGLDNETINQGIGIDLLDGVTAYDSDGDEIPFTVSPEELDKCDVGRHTVTYTATGKGTATIPYLCGKDELETPSCGNVTRSQDRTIVITQADDPVISGADYTEIEPNTDFNPLSGVTAVDDNGNTLVPTYSGTYYGVADGEIASFNTEISAPMKSLLVTLNPKQSGSGTPSPDNIRPISGWDEVETVVSGVNVWDEEWEVGGLTWAGGVPISSNDRIRSKNFCKCLPNTAYYGNTNIAVFFYDNNKDFINYIGAYASTFTTPSNAYYFKILKQGTTTYNNDISINYPSTDHDYHAYEGDTYTTDLPQTVYGGTLDVVSGVLTVDRAMVDMGAVDYAMYSSGFSRARFRTTALETLIKKPPNNNTPVEAVSSIFDLVKWSTGNSINVVGVFGVDTDGDLSVWLNASDYTDATAFKTAMSGQTLVYELTTPTTIQCDPQTVQTLIGDNNVWGGDGDTRIVYLDNIPQGTFQYAENGLYEITYTAEDECGNSTTVVRQIQVGAITYRTVIYEDGTLIINESSNDIDTNIEAHGSPTHIYEPLNEDGTNYVWTSEPTALWHESSAVYRIKQVEIGSEIYPTSTAFWFYDLRYCTHIDLNGIHTDNVTSMRYMFGYVGYFEEMADVIDVSMFNTENVTDMSSMFNHCMVTSINVSGFDTSKVTNMNRMFGYCANLERICSSGRFVIYNVTDGSNAFYDDTNLVGGNGTAYSYNYIDVSYARLDDPPNEPGYFTDCSA